MGSVWILYKINTMAVDDLMMNMMLTIMLIYVSIGNLILQFNGDEQ